MTVRFSLSAVGGVLSLVLGYIVALLGGWDVAIRVLAIMMVLDLIGGLFQAAAERHVNSSVCFRGVLKKLMYPVFVMAAYAFDTATPSDPAIWRSIVILLLSVVEFISIIEHAAALGVPVPKALVDALEKLKAQADAGELPTEPKPRI